MNINIGQGPINGGCDGAAVVNTLDGFTHLFIASPGTGYINHFKFPVDDGWASLASEMRIPGSLVGITAYYDVTAGQVHVIAANTNYVYESVFNPGTL